MHASTFVFHFRILPVSVIKCKIYLKFYFALVLFVTNFFSSLAKAESNPALQALKTPFSVTRWHIVASENDFIFSDRHLTQFSQIMFVTALNDDLSLNVSLKHAIYTPRLIKPKVIREKGNPYWSTTDEAFHNPFFVELQAVHRLYLMGLGVRLAAHTQIGIDATEILGGPVQNLPHAIFYFPFVDHMGTTQFYGGLGASAFIEYPITIPFFSGEKLLSFGLHTELTTFSQSFGVLLALSYKINPLTNRLFVMTEGLNTRLYSLEGEYEKGIRFMTGIQVSVTILESPNIDLDFKLVYDYNNIRPHLNHFRHTFIPSISLSFPLD